MKELGNRSSWGNHWHLLVTLDTAEPNPLQDAPDGVFLDHLGLIYSDTEVQKIGWQLESFRAGGLEKAAAALRQRECGAARGGVEDRSRTRGVWSPRKSQTHAQRSAKPVAQSDQRFLDRISQTTQKRQTQRVRLQAPQGSLPTTWAEVPQFRTCARPLTARVRRQGAEWLSRAGQKK